MRKKVGAEYYGCLRIDVLQSGDLYRRIEGWVTGITSAASSSG